MGDAHHASPIDWSRWVPRLRATLMFVVRDHEVLLIEKQRGMGAGKINAPGGKIDDGETPVQSAIRETEEELRITPLAPRKVGELFFAMTDLPDIHCHVFRAREYSGEVTATAEAIPHWTAIHRIPYELMWEDDRYWLPRMLEGRSFRGRFCFEGERVVWKQVEFGVPYHE